MGKWVTLVIIAFWLAMMGWLVQREVIPAIAQARIARERSGSYEELLQGPRARRAITMGVYWGEKKVGETTTTIRPRENGEWNVHTDTQLQPASIGMALPMLGKYAAAVPGNLQVLTDSAISADHKLISFSARVKSSMLASYWASIEGVTVGNKINMTVKYLSGPERALQLPFDSRHSLFPDFSAPLIPTDLKVGRSWRIEVFNPFASLDTPIQTASAEVVRREPMNVRGADQDVYLIETTSGKIKLKSWVTQSGEVIKQEAPFGFTLRRDDLLGVPAPIPEEKARTSSHDRN